MKRIHTTSSPLKLSPMIIFQPLMARQKPYGLWYGFNDDWIQFWYSESLHKVTSLYIYEIKLDMSNILIINSLKDLNKFFKEYTGQLSIRSKIPYNINWYKVAEKYKGFEINIPESHIDAYFMLGDIDWLLSWDINSGCIWDPSAIEEIKETKEYK